MNLIIPVSLAVAVLVFGCNEPPKAPPSSDSCQQFEPCGGDPTGTWTIFDVCYDQETVLAASAAAIDHPACEGWLDAVEVSLDGSLSFQDGVLESSLVLTQYLDTAWSPGCAEAAVGLSQPLDESSCNGIGDALTTDREASAQCALEGSVCNCRVQVLSNLSNKMDYALERGQVVSSKGRSDFCVEGTDLLFRGQTGAKIPELVMILRRD